MTKTSPLDTIEQALDAYGDALVSQRAYAGKDDRAALAKDARLLERARESAQLIAAARFETASRVYSHNHAQVLALALIEASQWFSVTPLPFDKYRISVKAENKSLLKPASAFRRVATKI